MVNCHDSSMLNLASLSELHDPFLLVKSDNETLVRITYSQAMQTASQVAAQLRSCLPKTEGSPCVVGVLLPNGLSFVVTLLALWTLPHVIVHPMNPLITLNEIANIPFSLDYVIMSTSDPREITGSIRVTENNHAVSIKTEDNQDIYLEDSEFKVDVARVGLYLLTSGSTGRPKGTPFLYSFCQKSPI